MYGRILTGLSTCTVILLPALTTVPAVGYAIRIPCANAEAASEAKVTKDASFIIRFNGGGRCNGDGGKYK